MQTFHVRRDEFIISVYDDRGVEDSRLSITMEQSITDAARLALIYAQHVANDYPAFVVHLADTAKNTRRRILSAKAQAAAVEAADHAADCADHSRKAADSAAEEI